MKLGTIAFIAAAVFATAEVPPDIAAKLKELGRGVCPAETAALYRPLQPKAPYPGVKVDRDVSFGPDARNVVDIFSPEKGGGKRPVLIYVAGGAGNKIEQVPNGDAFYDNIMLWAVKNGMTGVNLQRRNAPGMAWDDPAKDIGLGIEWVRNNIAKYKGNPNRIFIWAHSAGNPPVATYIGHPELYGPSGIGLKGADPDGAREFQHPACDGSASSARRWWRRLRMWRSRERRSWRSGERRSPCRRQRRRRQGRRRQGSRRTWRSRGSCHASLRAPIYPES